MTDIKKVSLPVSWEGLAQKLSKRKEKMKKVYEVKGLSLSVLDNQELSQLFAESQKLVDEFSKTNKQELTYISKLARFTPLFEDFRRACIRARVARWQKT